MHPRIRIGRGQRGDPLERGQVLGRRGEQLVEDRGRRGAIVAAVLEDLRQPQAERGDVLVRRAARDRLGDPRPQDVGGLAALAAAGEDVGVVDEPADVVGRVLRRGSATTVAAAGRSPACSSARAWARSSAAFSKPLCGARRTLAADLGDLAPATELATGRRRARASARRSDGRRSTMRPVQRGRAIEAAVVAVELGGGEQRRVGARSRRALRRPARTRRRPWPTPRPGGTATRCRS